MTFEELIHEFVKNELTSEITLEDVVTSFVLRERWKAKRLKLKEISDISGVSKGHLSGLMSLGWPKNRLHAISRPTLHKILNAMDEDSVSFNDECHVRYRQALREVSRVKKNGKSLCLATA